MTFLAAPQGFEPRYADPESAVLPLNEGAILAAAESLHDGSYTIHSKSFYHIGQLTALVYLRRDVTSVSIKYNRIVRVELFLNLAWAMLSLTLSLLWISRLCVSVHSKQPDVKVQLLALAMLIVILLPVISMTDDMQAISAAEIEHVTRRADLLPNLDHARDLVALLDARLFPNSHLLNLQIFARVELFGGSERPQFGSIRQMAKRPPPLAA